MRNTHLAALLLAAAAALNVDYCGSTETMANEGRRTRHGANVAAWWPRVASRLLLRATVCGSCVWADGCANRRQIERNER